MELLQNQKCPYCGSIVDESRAEWEEGDHDVTCDSCKKDYLVEPIYVFKGFKVQKVCQECYSPKEDCFCEDED